jgi:hypothetical protein
MPNPNERIDMEPIIQACEDLIDIFKAEVAQKNADRAASLERGREQIKKQRMIFPDLDAGLRTR